MASHPHTITLGPTPLDRRAIERKIEELIDLLDTVDGDPDLEDDELDGDELELGEDNVLANDVPVYGLDQTAAIVAFRAAKPRKARP